MTDTSIKNDTEPTLVAGQLTSVASKPPVAFKAPGQIKVDTARVSDVGQLAAGLATAIQLNVLKNQAVLGIDSERLEALRAAYRTGSLRADLSKLSEIIVADEGR